MSVSLSNLSRETYGVVHALEDEALAEDKEIESLTNEARMCCVATKLAGCVCLPLTWACLLPKNCCFPDECLRNRRQDPVTQYLYSEWTACEGGWEPRLPPRDRCEQLRHIFDPFVCCIPFATKETAQHYLPPVKQERLVILVTKRQSQRPVGVREIVRDALTRDGRVPNGVVQEVLEFGFEDGGPNRQLMDIRAVETTARPYEHPLMILKHAF